MLTEPTLVKLAELNLQGILEAFLEQEKDPDTNALDFHERFSLLVDAEWILRQNKRLARNLREAKLRYTNACIEDIEASTARGLDKALIKKLATCQLIIDKLNLIISGQTGTGKSYVGCAVAMQACRKGFRVVYRRASRLYDDLALARAEGSYQRLLARLARVDLLVIDDFGLTETKEADAEGLLEVLEDRYNNRSTIITSQLAIKDWHEYLPEPTIADAICDRVVHNAYRIDLKGPSRRKEKSTTKTQN